MNRVSEMEFSCKCNYWTHSFQKLTTAQVQILTLCVCDHCPGHHAAPSCCSCCWFPVSVPRTRRLVETQPQINASQAPDKTMSLQLCVFTHYRLEKLMQCDKKELISLQQPHCVFNHSCIRSCAAFVFLWSLLWRVTNCQNFTCAPERVFVFPLWFVKFARVGIFCTSAVVQLGGGRKQAH